MNLQSHLQNEQSEAQAYAAPVTESGASAGADIAALEQARQAIVQSPGFVSASESPTVAEALRSEQDIERAQARMATLETLSALDKGVAQKQREEKQQQKAAEIQQSVEEMIRRLGIEIAQARRRRTGRQIRIGLYITFIAMMMWATHWRFAGNWWLWLWIGSGLWAADRTIGRRLKTVSELGQAGDPRAVGVLAIAAHDAERAVREPARQALLRLLPHVRADHAADITPPQMNALLELAFQSESAMQIAVLKAFEQIGDGRAVPVVHNLTFSQHPQVREQAKTCLPFLNERARRAEQSATLLRGTANPAQIASPRELLRPVNASADNTPPDELLRLDASPNRQD